MPFYAVHKGLKTGVFNTWAECQEQTVGFKGARYKKYDSEEDAKNFVIEGKIRREGDVPAVPVQKTEKAKKRESDVQEDDSNDATPSKKAKESEDSDSEDSGDDAKAVDGVSVWIDGCCHGAKEAGRGGIGIYWGADDEKNVSERMTAEGIPTIHRAEIFAAEKAIVQAKKEKIKDLVLYTKSSHLINSITLWIQKWKKNDWTLSDGRPVANKDELEALDAQLDGSINVKWVHIAQPKGVDGIEQAGQLSSKGARKDA